MNKKEESIAYIKQYPKLKKWINQCICCGGVGYNPTLPDIITSNDGNGEYETFAAQNLRRYFQPLELNETGICKVCQKFMSD